MINRLYVHNFRCLENFELPLAGRRSVLLVGANGVGKSTVRHALRLLQRIARGTNRVGQLVSPGECTRGRMDAPMRFELEVRLGEHLYRYLLALELPPRFRELRVFQEAFYVDGEPVFTRELAQVTLHLDAGQAPLSTFRVDWHLVALPILQERRGDTDPLFVFKQWLGRMMVLHPIPAQMSGASSIEKLEPEPDLSNLGEWWSGIIAHSPASYVHIDAYLKQLMPDLVDVKNPLTGSENRSLTVQFRGPLNLPFDALSDGEKCFFACALVLASNRAYGPIFCFWDEPDSHLSLSEVSHFVGALRREFETGGQFLMTSHNAEAIRRFSDENTIVLTRASHLEPPQVRWAESLGLNDDLASVLARGALP